MPMNEISEKPARSVKLKIDYIYVIESLSKSFISAA